MKADHDAKGGDSVVGQVMLDPRMLTNMYEMAKDDEIDLFEYWQVIWAKKYTIAIVALLVGVIAVVLSLRMPNFYKAEVLLAPVSEKGGASGGLSSALGGLGGLATMAGVSIGGSSDVDESLAVLKSREFLWAFVKDEKLMPLLFADSWDEGAGAWKKDIEQPTFWDAYRAASDLLSTAVDKKTGLVKVSVEWRDPELAALWANLLVERLNGYLQHQAVERSKGRLTYLYEELGRTQVEDMRRVLFELITREQKKAMVANTQKQYAFQVIDAAVAPDRKSKPKRAQMVLIAVFGTVAMMVVGILVFDKIRAKRAELNSTEARDVERKGS